MPAEPVLPGVNTTDDEDDVPHSSPHLTIYRIASVDERVHNEVLLTGVGTGSVNCACNTDAISNMALPDALGCCFILCNRTVGALEYASKELRGDKEFMIEFVKKNYYALQFASEELKDNKEVVLIAIEKYYAALQFKKEGEGLLSQESGVTLASSLATTK